MSVAVAVKAYVTPIMRNPKERTLRRVYGRWHGQCSVTGDGSGGQVQLTIALGARGDYPPRMVWTYSFGLVYMSVYNAATWVSGVSPYELTTAAEYLDFAWAGSAQQIGTAGMAALQPAGFNGFVEYHFRLPEQGALAANVYAQSSVNTNLTSYGFKAGGLLLHEELI